MSAKAEHTGRFGTLGGVFTPCVLTILGVIMFLRLGEVVGNAGVLGAVGIILAAKLITTLTGLSLSAIATNTRTKGGGAYYLISRSLGMEFGGTIGLVFFLAQAISVAMYVIGFSEAFQQTFPDLGWSITWIGTLVNIVVFICVYVGAGWAIKVQYLILLVLASSIVSFAFGAFGQASYENFQANLGSGYTSKQSLITMFALFFPAVTGIMAGANMSGDLKDSARSIPRGTLSAIVVTGIIYVGLTFLLGASRSREQLLGDSLVMVTIASVPWLITAGVFAATLSSALGSMMGSPRILQAFARDRILPTFNFFAKGSGENSEPRRATILTFLIAQVCIFLGDLNAIAPVITMAFMITYGMLNLATFYETVTLNPSYRPTFRYCPWFASLAGAILCLGVMFLISPLSAAIAILGMGALYWVMGQREVQAHWGDLRSGLAFERARKNLAILEEELYHPKNWRPIMITFSGAGGTRRHLAVYGHWLTFKHGIQTLGQVIKGEVADLLERRAAQRELLRRFIKEEELTAFPAVVISESTSEGIVALVQCHGLGGLESNTVLLGWPESPERWDGFTNSIRAVSGLDRSLVIVRSLEEDETIWTAPNGFIDVWWRGRLNGTLMLILAHLLTKNAAWRDRRVRLMRVIANEAGKDEVLEHMEETLKLSRIRALPSVVVGDDPISEIQKMSRDAAIVFLGFEIPEDGQEESFMKSMEALGGSLPRVIFVNSAGGVELES